MSVIRNFFRRSFPEQLLLVRAVIVVSAATISLRLLPFNIVTQLFNGGNARGRSYTAEDIARAVAAAGRRVPGANCLPEALACMWLLRRNGFDGELRIGTRFESSYLRAHAWLESGGRVLLGGEDSPASFSAFPFPRSADRS